MSGPDCEECGEHFLDCKCHIKEFTDKKCEHCDCMHARKRFVYHSIQCDECWNKNNIDYFMFKMTQKEFDKLRKDAKPIPYKFNLINKNEMD